MSYLGSSGSLGHGNMVLIIVNAHQSMLAMVERWVILRWEIILAVVS